jgi:hypothetical protein
VQGIEELLKAALVLQRQPVELQTATLTVHLPDFASHQLA